jgi:KUP system potassium uptake protein
MASSTTHVPPILVHMVERERALHEKVLLLTVVTETVPEVPAERRLTVKSLRPDMHHIVATYGFMQKPDVPAVTRDAAARLGITIDPSETTYYLGRESVQHGNKGAMGMIAESLFSYLQRNAVAADRHFHIPARQIIEVGIQLDL